MTTRPSKDHKAKMRRRKQHLYAPSAIGRLHEVERLCSDCPPPDYPTQKTRCANCPRRPR